MILAIQAGLAILIFYAGFLAGQLVATKKATKMIDSTVINQKQTIK